MNRVEDLVILRTRYLYRHRLIAKTHKDEVHQEPPDAPVAVLKRMNLDEARVNASGEFI
jgi:hypothetical protein